MKVMRMAVPLIVLGIAVFVQAQKSSDLKKEAKITKEQATATALAKVPGGKVKEAELERENGKLVWSFDIVTPGAKDITEVQVDAKTGEVVSQHKESAAAEAAEKKAEKQKAPPKK
jgi:uncharacterized membrane protein YkoI